MSILERGISFLRILEQRRIDTARSSGLPHIRIKQHLRDGGRVVFQFGESEPVTIEGTDGTDIRSEGWGNIMDALRINRNEALHLRLLDSEGDVQKSFIENQQPRDLLKEIRQSLAWN